MEQLIFEKNDPFPLNLSLVRKVQQHELKTNKTLKQMVNNNDEKYNLSSLEDVELIIYKNRIYVPKALRNKTLAWYHHFLNNPGGDRLYNTLKQVC